MSIAPLTSLAHLHLAILDVDVATNMWIPVLLAQAVALPLRTLTFDIWLHHTNQLNCREWDVITFNITQFVLRSSSIIKEVTVVHRGDLKFHLAQQTLHQRMADLSHRKMLRVLNRVWTG